MDSSGILFPATKLICTFLFKPSRDSIARLLSHGTGLEVPVCACRCLWIGDVPGSPDLRGRQLQFETGRRQVWTSWTQGWTVHKTICQTNLECCGTMAGSQRIVSTVENFCTRMPLARYKHTVHHGSWARPNKGAKITLKRVRQVFETKKKNGSQWESFLASVSLWEVHLWSEHLAVVGGQPFCGSRMSHTACLTWRTYPPQWMDLYGRCAVCHTPLVTLGEYDPPPPTDKRQGGGLRTAVAPALFLVSGVVVLTCHTEIWPHAWSSPPGF